MPSPADAVLLIVLPVSLLFGVVHMAFVRESESSREYNQVRIGMTVDEVRALLGSGVPVLREKILGIVVAVNREDAAASRRKAEAAGVVPTARDYPTRRKPPVEGDLILRWEDAETGERILVAFKDGKVCEKHYWDPNYL